MCTLTTVLAVDARGGPAGQSERRVQVLERPQVTEVEDRAEVDVEAVGALAGEHLLAARQRVTAAAASAG